jgi:hypothetical protein
MRTDDRGGRGRLGRRIRSGSLGVVLGVLAAALPGAGTSETATNLVRTPSGCPRTMDGAVFSSAAQLREWNRVMAEFGGRPTGSESHAAFIDWLEARMLEIDGVRTRSLFYRIDRWTPQAAGLRLRVDNNAWRDIAIAGPVPYSRSATATGPLIYVPSDTAIADAKVAGKVVLRDHTTASVPLAVFLALSYYAHDPGLTLNPLEPYERDWLAYMQRVTDLEEAAQAGARAVIFVHGFPRAQVLEHYEPYEGLQWGVPAVYVGADEGQLLKRRALRAGGATAEVTVQAQRAPVTTRTLIATLPGASDERIVVDSHTDGMNAVWDNGPIGMLALARALAPIPVRCR